MIPMKSDKSMRLLTAFLALGILISGWGLLALASQHRADRAIANRQAAQIARNEQTINNLANALVASNVSFSEHIAKNQREIELNRRQIAALKQQVIDLGGKPVIVIAGSQNTGTSSTPKSSPRKSSKAKPSPKPSPSPTCTGPSVGPVCLP